MNKKFSKVLYVLLVIAVLGAGGYYLFKKNIGTINVPSTNSVDTTKSLGEEVSNLKVPAGMHITYFAKDVPGARVIEIDPQARLIVSETSEGKISALSDTNNDGVSDENKVIASGLDKPHGLAFKCDGNKCSLYVAEHSALLVFDYDAQSAILSNKRKLANIDASATDRHFTRSLQFIDNDKTLLISTGSSCNVCNEPSPDKAKILAYDISTGTLSDYARGLRNAVFMTRNPVDGRIFATEMGRDNLGDNIPPDEINIIEKDKNYGWPICYGKNIHDTEFDKNTYIRNPCMAPFETPSFVDLQAHSAPLGLGFIPEEGWPEEYWYNLLVAYHGSWNRSTPTGYKVVRIKMNAKGEYLGTEDFITGWLTSAGDKSGRPAGIKILSGGVAYISDDSLGAVYRLSANN